MNHEDRKELLSLSEAGSGRFVEQQKINNRLKLSCKSFLDLLLQFEGLDDLLHITDVKNIEATNCN